MKNRATNTTTLNPSNRSGKTDVNDKKVNLASSNNNNESSGPIKGKRIKIKTQGQSNRTRTIDNPRPSNRTRTYERS